MSCLILDADRIVGTLSHVFPTHSHVASTMSVSGYYSAEYSRVQCLLGRNALLSVADGKRLIVASAWLSSFRISDVFAPSTIQLEFDAVQYRWRGKPLPIETPIDTRLIESSQSFISLKP